MPDENKAVPPPPQTATPEHFEKGARGADQFPAPDPIAMQVIFAERSPFAASPEVGSPQAGPAGAS